MFPKGGLVLGGLSLCTAHPCTCLPAFKLPGQRNSAILSPNRMFFAQKTFAFADLLAAMQNNIGCTFYPSSIWPPRPNRALEVYWIPHHLPCTKGKMWAFLAASLFHVLLEYAKFGFCAKLQFLTSIFSTLSSLLISLSLFIFSFQPHFFTLLWLLTSLLLFLPAVKQFFSFNLLYSITIEQFGFKWYKRAKNCTRPLNVNIRIILA